MCRCMWSRNLVNEEALTRVGPQRHGGWGGGTWRSNGYQPCLVFWMYRCTVFKFGPGIHVFFANIRHFPQSLQENAGVVTQNAPDFDLDVSSVASYLQIFIYGPPLLFKSFPINCSFHTVWMIHVVIKRAIIRNIFPMGKVIYSTFKASSDLFRMTTVMLAVIFSR